MAEPVQESGWFHPLVVVIENRFEQRGVYGQLTGRSHLDDPPEKTKRPYGILVPVAVRGQKFTNQTKYADIEFRLEIYADRFEQLDDVLCPIITDALQYAPLVPENGRLKVTMIRPGDIEYDKVEQIWIADMNFVAQCNQPKITPAPVS